MSGAETVTAATLSGALVFGMTLALFGRLKLALGQRLQAEDGQVRRLLLALYIALMPMVLLCGLLLDRFGARPVLLGGSAALAAALASLSVRPAHLHTFAAVLLAGLGAAALGTASTVLMPWALFALEETSASLNLGYVFIALGALLTATLTDLLLGSLGPRRTLALFALLALVPAFLAIFPSEQWRSPDHASDVTAFIAEPSSWLAALVFFFYVPLEASVSLWTFTLLAERGQDERRASGLLSGFWAAFLVSRLLTALAQHVYYLSEWWDRCLVVVAPLLAAVVLGNLAGASYRGRPRAGLILLGLLLGPVLPTLLGLLFRQVAPAEQGLAYGVVFAAGSLGSLLWTPLLGPRTEQPLQTALRLPIFLALLLTATALVLELMTP